MNCILRKCSISSSITEATVGETLERSWAQNHFYLTLVSSTICCHSCTTACHNKRESKNKHYHIALSSIDILHSIPTYYHNSKYDARYTKLISFSWNEWGSSQYDEKLSLITLKLTINTTCKEWHLIQVVTNVLNPWISIGWCTGLWLRKTWVYIQDR